MEAGPYARQSLNRRDMEEEMKQVLQFLDTSLITPPSGSDLVTQQQIQPLPQEPPLPQQPTPEEQREMVALQENEGGTYRGLGEVIDLMGSLDANDTNPALQQQRPQDAENASDVGGRLNFGGDVSRNEIASSQMNEATQASSNYSGVESISPVGLLNGPSMSPATINWLQTLVPSTSTESLAGLISPATLYGGGGGLTSCGMIGTIGSAGSVQADGATTTRSGGLPRTPSCEIIDWKAYNESCSDKAQMEPVKWRVIPQHGPHADPAISGVGHITSPKLPPSNVEISELSTHKQMQRIMAEERNKRKALVSPEYVQYGCSISMTASATSRSFTGNTEMEHDPVQYATKVPEPTGRRPFKKYLHKTSPAVESSSEEQLQQQQDITTNPSKASADGKDDMVRCKCTGKCRNARCACVKAGLVCGTQCKCASCANPFVPMAREGIDIQLMVHDMCLMQHLSKIKDMQELLDSTVSYECCEGGGGVVQVKHTLENGFPCPHCGAHFTYSWCNNRLCPDAKKPRRHCAKCRRCGDHRNQHCDICNHCYFAGVANSFRCSCQSSGNGSGKTRAVVPNPVCRDSNSVTKHENGEKQIVPQPYGSVNMNVEEAVCGENSGATTKSGAEEKAGDSCKLQ